MGDAHRQLHAVSVGITARIGLRGAAAHGADLRRALALVKTLGELDDLLAQLDPDVPFPPAAEGPRGRQGSPGSVTLPEGWLSDPDDCTVPSGADVMHSGG